MTDSRLNQMIALADDLRTTAADMMAELPTDSGDRWRIAQSRTLANEIINHLNLLLPQESA